jgi:hypothetical protein
MAAALNRLDSNGLLYPAGIACGRAHTFQRYLSIYSIHFETIILILKYRKNPRPSAAAEVVSKQVSNRVEQPRILLDVMQQHGLSCCIDSANREGGRASLKQGRVETGSCGAPESMPVADTSAGRQA